MYNDIGFYLTDINENSHNNILDSINEFIENNPYKNVIVFNNVFNKINTNNKYYLLHLNEAKYFNGILFMFNPTDASICSTFPGPLHKIFYTSEIYWQNNPYIPYISWKNIFLKNIETIVSSEEHYNIYSTCWKKPLLTEKNFTTETITNVIKAIR